MYHQDVYLFFFLVASAISLMMLAGLSKHGLERKARRVICPACGREAGRRCRCRRR